MVTLSGIITLSKALQPLNASFGISLRFDGKTTFLSAVISLNTSLANAKADEVQLNLIDVIDDAPDLNASLLTPTTLFPLTLSGTTTSVSLPSYAVIVALEPLSSYLNPSEYSDICPVLNKSPIIVPIDAIAIANTATTTIICLVLFVIFTSKTFSLT